jgi:hypothetical protein
MSLRINLLLEDFEKRIVNEIGEGNIKPFIWSGKFYNIPPNKGYLTVFLAPLETQESIPEITVVFLEKEPGYYAVGFDVNEEDTQAFKSNSTYYLRIMSTVVNIVKSFIKNKDPKTLLITSTDKRTVTTPGQKDRIYWAFLEKLVPTLGSYETGRGEGGFLIMKRDKPK